MAPGTTRGSKCSDFDIRISEQARLTPQFQQELCYSLHPSQRPTTFTLPKDNMAKFAACTALFFCATLLAAQVSRDLATLQAFDCWLWQPLASLPRVPSCLILSTQLQVVSAAPVMEPMEPEPTLQVIFCCCSLHCACILLKLKNDNESLPC